VSSLVILAVVVFQTSCGEEDKLTNRHKNAAKNPTTWVKVHFFTPLCETGRYFTWL